MTAPGAVDRGAVATEVERQLRGLGLIYAAAAPATTSYPMVAGESGFGTLLTQYPVGDVRRYGADRTGVASSQVALDSVRAMAAALPTGSQFEIVFPAGRYRYATAPDWGISGLTVRAEGRVILDHTGAGPGVRFGADALALNVYNVRLLGDFSLTGTAATTFGLFCRNMHHSVFELEVANAVGVAKIQGSVLSTFKLRASVNYAAWTTTPTSGVTVEAGTAGNTTESTLDLILEGINGTGLILTAADGCLIYGTSEANVLGASIAAASTKNRFDAFWCEANSAGDFDVSGKGTRWTNCYASSVGGVGSLKVRTGATFNAWEGGEFNTATIDAGAEDNSLLHYLGTAVVDNGTRTWDQGLKLAVSSVPNPARIPITGPRAAATMLGTWVNTTGNYIPLRYFRNWSTGEVVLEGEVGGGVAGTAIMTLPAGLLLRPITYKRVFICPATGSKDYAIIEVDTAGNVTHLFGNVASISLESVRFVP